MPACTGVDNFVVIPAYGQGKYAYRGAARRGHRAPILRLCTARFSGMIRLLLR